MAHPSGRSPLTRVAKGNLLDRGTKHSTGIRRLRAGPVRPASTRGPDNEKKRKKKVIINRDKRGGGVSLATGAPTFTSRILYITRSWHRQLVLRRRRGPREPCNAGARRARASPAARVYLYVLPRGINLSFPLTHSVCPLLLSFSRTHTLLYLWYIRTRTRAGVSRVCLFGCCVLVRYICIYAGMFRFCACPWIIN